MSKQTTPAAVYRFNDPGDGRFVTGVPQRDLTAADLGRIDAGTLRRAVATGLYTEITPPPAPPLAPDAGKGGEAPKKGNGAKGPKDGEA